jgi:hypothetical protein
MRLPGYYINDDQWASNPELFQKHICFFNSDWDKHFNNINSWRKNDDLVDSNYNCLHIGFSSQIKTIKWLLQYHMYTISKPMYEGLPCQYWFVLVEFLSGKYKNPVRLYILGDILRQRLNCRLLIWHCLLNAHKKSQMWFSQEMMDALAH